MEAEFNFLVDVNLPKHFSFFNKSNFTFVSDLNISMSDLEIWDIALESNFIILTKDTDFYDRSILSNNSPKIIHFKFGNFSLKQLYQYFQANWSTIISELPLAKIIIAFDNHIEVIYSE